MSGQYIRNQLLCTFTKPKHLEQNVDEISEKYELINDKIICIQNVEDDNEMFCIYNIPITEVNGNYRDTILMHRKRKTNTLYTINSLNAMIWLLNDGKFDHNFQVPWNNYRNSLLLIRQEEVDVVHTKLYKTFRF